ncbi:MAG: SigB/SigF/SigG family RNA polymerase sigma factor [Clostridia bacterium]|nr:SigB/SigF/SigG family RNA polymerase sigma factor [Clostridia bacterium]
MDSKRIEDNMGLVYSVVKRFLGRGTEYDDLVQIGSIGLIKAAENFDESKGFCFSTYAVPMIIGEIKRFLRDDGAVKVSRTLKENAGKIGYATEKLSKKLGRSPTLSEIEEETGLNKEEIAEALDAAKPLTSIYEQNEDDTYVLDKIVTKESEEEKNIERIFLKELLDSLDNRSRKVILLRYFKEETQQQVADRLGVSQVQVSRIEKKVLETLRKQCEKGD